MTSQVIETAVKKPAGTKFYEFRQNNSGGSFDVDCERGISIHVLVEATDSNHANMIAQEIGLYFDGAGDCPCCGDRWYGVSEYDANTVPAVYGKPIGEYYSTGTPIFTWTDPDEHEAYVHYLDGRVVGYQFDSVIETQEDC